MGDAQLVVRFRPGAWEAFWATLVLVVGLTLLGTGTPGFFVDATQAIACDRAHCRVTWHTVFGTGSDMLQVADLHGSRIDTTDGRREWIVDEHGKPYTLGPPTKDSERVAAYQRLAPQLEAFLDDPGRTTFTGSFTRDVPSPVLFAILGLLLTAWGIKWRRGWRAVLTFDRPARTLTIAQRPWMRRRTIPVETIGGIQASDRVAHSTYGNFRWEEIVLADKDGKALWRYRTMFTRKAAQRVRDSVQAIRDFLASR